MQCLACILHVPYLIIGDVIKSQYLEADSSKIIHLVHLARKINCMGETKRYRFFFMPKCRDTLVLICKNVANSIDLQTRLYTNFYRMRSRNQKGDCGYSNPKILILWTTKFKFSHQLLRLYLCWRAMIVICR